MGVGQSEKAIPADSSLVTISRGLQLGVLRSASAVVSDGSPPAGAIWCYLALCQGHADKFHVVSPLGKGYITEEDPIIAHCNIKLTGNYILTAMVRGTHAVTVRIFATIDIT